MCRLIRLGVVPVLCFVMLAYSTSFEKNYVQGSINELSRSTLPVMTGTLEEETPASKSAVEVFYTDVKDEFSTYNENNPKMAALLEGLKKESAGVVGWLVGLANSEKVIFYNSVHMLTYSVVERCFSGAIDLLPLNAGHIQGDEVTFFSFSPQGDYVIINNGFGTTDSNWAATMYLADVRTGDVREIGVANHFRITDAWSASSRFYAFADRDGGQATIYDLVTGTKNTVEFGQEPLKRILVNDYGDVLIDAQTIYRLAKGKGYSLEKLGIRGEALEVNGQDLVYFSEGAIQKFNLISGSNGLLKKMPGELQLRQVKKGQAVFTVKDGTVSVIYNLRSGNLYEYRYTYDSFPGLLGWSFAPDSKHCVVYGDGAYRVIDEWGQQETIHTADNNMFSFTGDWIDNNTFVTVLIRDNHDFAAGNFHICAYNSSAKQRAILYEQ